MNILFVYPTLFHPNRGGVERVTDILTREFLKRGHHVHYLHNKHNEKLEDFNYAVRPEYFPFEDYRDGRNADFYLDYLKRNDIDIIINQCGAFEDSVLYNRRDGSKAGVVSVIHNSPYSCYHHLMEEVSALRDTSMVERLKRIARIALYPKIKRDYLGRLRQHYGWLGSGGNTDAIALLSDSFRRDLASLLPADPTAIVEAIGNPLSFPIERLDKKEKMIIFVGRLDTGQKRADRMVRIWRRIAPRFPDWQLCIIGDGPDRAKIERMARGLDRISFTGFRNPEPFYRRASVLCMTSNFEGFPMVLGEAQSKGCVPIAFDSFSAVRDIITDRRQLVSPFNMDEYAAALSALLESPALLGALRQQGYENAGAFVAERIADKWEALFEKITR